MIKFSKYNSCGNDFIIIDNRKNIFPTENRYIKKLCDRHLGVGSDGLILLEEDPEVNYFMNYFNSDGFPSSFCGNGSMCCAHFASTIGLLNNIELGIGSFRTREGIFSFKSDIKSKKTTISMVDVVSFDKNNTRLLINTGSPHYVTFKSNLKNINIHREARKIRYSRQFYEDGINVTFVEFLNSNLFIRTYERGVEAETLSCGTGAVAAALATLIYDINQKTSIIVTTIGGLLKVQCKVLVHGFSDITLESVVQKEFESILPDR